MGYSKHELSTINILYSPQKYLSYYTLPPHDGHLSTTATFVCPQGGHCGEGGLRSSDKQYTTHSMGLA